MKKIVKIVTFLLILCSTFFINVEANNNDYLYLGGDSIGVKMDTGVYVAGKYQVQTKKGKVCPWKNANIEVGDKIEKINNIQIYNNEGFNNYLMNCTNKNIEITLKRGNSYINTFLDVVSNALNEKSIGLYIRDKILGIGTLTYITPEYAFGSLGHGIYDNNVLLNSTGGKLFYSNVSSIKKAEPGIAGEKRASISNDSIGQIINNDITGLYGIINTRNFKSEKVLIRKQEDVKLGKAKIYTTLSNNIVKGYDIEIVENNIQKTSDIKGLKIKITDKELLSVTGGIIQGMSGSPIVQDGYIVGAVSHVTVDNPIMGYGMHIEWMLEKTNEL